jgi:hypothetical protein
VQEIAGQDGLLDALDYGVQHLHGAAAPVHQGGVGDIGPHAGEDLVQTIQGKVVVEFRDKHPRYGAGLAERRYEHVDPAKRHVARALEARWNAALERVAEIEQKLRAGSGRRGCPEWGGSAPAPGPSSRTAGRTSSPGRSR